MRKYVTQNEILRILDVLGLGIDKGNFIARKKLNKELRGDLEEQTQDLFKLVLYRNPTGVYRVVQNMVRINQTTRMWKTFSEDQRTLKSKEDIDTAITQVLNTSSDTMGRLMEAIDK